MKKIPNNFIWEHKQLLLLFFFFFADMTDIALELEKKMAQLFNCQSVSILAIRLNMQIDDRKQVLYLILHVNISKLFN